jgi:hypothetical protein
MPVMTCRSIFSGDANLLCAFTLEIKSERMILSRNATACSPFCRMCWRRWSMCAAYPTTWGFKLSKQIYSCTHMHPCTNKQSNFVIKYLSTLYTDCSAKQAFPPCSYTYMNIFYASVFLPWTKISLDFQVLIPGHSRRNVKSRRIRVDGDWPDSHQGCQNHASANAWMNIENANPGVP